uniref:Methyltransferase-like protein 13 n=1 Tax=Parascaris univalens TaxID=6257 RepID=A0A915C545_PARUN
MLPIRGGSLITSTRGWSLRRRMSHFVRRFVRRQQPFDLFAFFKLIVMLGAAATALFYYVTADWPVIVEDSKYGVLSGMDASRFVLDRMCSQVTNSCFVVFDTFDLIRNTAIRNLGTEGFDETVDAIVRLRPPEGVQRIIESDTRIWAVDHLWMPTSYGRVMVAAPFVTSSLELAERVNLKAKILCIGLGGGGISMFLASKFPKTHVTVVEIEPVVVLLAKRWFDVGGRDNHDVHTMNGITYIMESEERFDAVLIDACDVDVVLPCPAAEFLDEQLIETLSKKLLTPNGTLAVNILQLQSADKKLESVLKLFKRSFVSCIAVRMEEGNLLLICFNHTPPTREISLLRRRFGEVWYQLQSDDLAEITHLAFYS